MLTATSCITQQKCNDRFPFVTRDSIDTIETVIEVPVHDTVFWEPREVVIHDSLPCPELEYHKEVENKGLKQTIDIHKGILLADCKSDSLQAEINRILHGKQIVITDLKRKIETNNITTNILKGWQKVFIVFGWLFLAIFLAVIVGIVLKFIK